MGKSCVIGRRRAGGMEPKKQALDTVAVELVEEILQAPEEWAVVDEIGFLEEASPAYQDILLQLFDKKRVLGAIRKEELPFLNRLRARGDCLVLDLDELDWVPKIGCVVLAAGQGGRFGDNKLLHPLAGGPVLSHVLKKLPHLPFAKILVVCASDGVEQLCGRMDIPCLRYGGGPQGESIHRGIQEMDGMDGCMFFMGDQPLVTKGSVERILLAFLDGPERIIRLSWQGAPCSPVLFPRKYFSALSALQGERGGMAAVQGMEPEIVLVEASAPQELWDVDTPQDLAQMEDCLVKETSKGE